MTAYQQILDATGELAGTTGHFFVSGFNINNHVVTQVTRGDLFSMSAPPLRGRR